MFGKTVYCLLLLIISLAWGCAETVHISPTLNSSLGLKAFETMRTIDRQNLALGFEIDPEVKDFVLSAEIVKGSYRFRLGEVLYVKFIKALAYRFKSIIFVQKGTHPGGDTIDAILKIQIKDADVDVQRKAGWAMVEAVSHIRLTIRAELLDPKDRKTIWVGTSQTVQTYSHQEGSFMLYQELGRGMAQAIDASIDQAVGEILEQMVKSANFQEFLKRRDKEV
ncbi:MAG: hypothetical protein QXP27_07890 [Candidatus Methanomethyliaceae archaeon]